MKINRFMSHIDTMARQNRFEVDIFCPAINLRLRALRCKNAVLPGKNMTVEPFSEMGTGPVRQYLKGVEYVQDIVLTFICDNTFEDKQGIEAWQQYMYGDDYSLRYPLGFKAEGSMFGQMSTGYTGTVIIRQMDRGDNVIYEVELLEAFPQSIAAQNLDMASSEIQTFDVTFNYRTWYSAFENEAAGSILGAMFQKGIKKIKSKVRTTIEDKVFKERRTLTKRLGID